MISIDLTEVGAGSGTALHNELHRKLLAVREQFLRSEAEEQSVPVAGTLSHLITSIVELSCSDVVLILDHASRLKVQIGEQVLKALKAARDAVNARPDSNRRFFLVAVDSDCRALHELTSDPAQAFLGANVLELTNNLSRSA